jgi:alanine-glyoxylate transaminase/serine-glyoxylate transaminase/serine-pyruvate transaminase
MGLTMHVRNPSDRLWTLNTPCVPEGVDDAQVRKFLLEERGIEIAGGFGPLAGKVFRIGLMGYGSTAENVGFILEALGDALASLRRSPGRPHSHGADSSTPSLQGA